MKRIVTFSVFATILLFACRKDDNPRIPELSRVPLPLVLIDAASEKFISPLTPTAFKGKISVDMYFKNDEPPQKFDLVVMKNNNKGKVAVAREGITTFPTVVDLTGAQLTSLFGEPMKPADIFDIGVDITTKNGQKFPAFPTTGSPYGTNIFVQPNSNVAVQFLVPCPFVSSEYAGGFEVITDEWADYSPGAVIPVKVVGPNQLSFEYNVDPGTAKPIILNVNPVNNAITVAKQVFGSYGGDEYSAVSATSDANIVNPCDHSLNVKLTITTTGYSKDFTIKLRKK